MVTIKMLAERCGLSVSAVSKALNDQPGISPEKAEMVKRAAKEMGYYPNAAARTLRMHRSHNIGVLFENELAHELFSVVLDGVRQEAGCHGYDITFLTDSMGARAMSYYDHAKMRQCDGVIIAQGAFDTNSVARLVESEIPCVSIDYVYNGRTAILSNNTTGMEQVVSYLASMGHRKIAYIHGEPGDVTRQRLAGFHRGCRKCGISVPEEYIVQARFQEPKDSAVATRDLMTLPDPPTCILYPDDVCYLGGRTALERLKLSVPGDVSCFGYDGVKLAGYLRPRLSTYRQNAKELGKRAAAELICAIEDPKYYVPRVLTVTGQIQTGETVRNLHQTGTDQSYDEK